MGKGKPRHNPDKPQNKYGKVCKCYLHDGGYFCPAYHKNMVDIIKICNLNPHNCSKVKYRLFASMSEEKKENIKASCGPYYL